VRSRERDCECGSGRQVQWSAIREVNERREEPKRDASRKTHPNPVFGTPEFLKSLRALPNKYVEKLKANVDERAAGICRSR